MKKTGLVLEGGGFRGAYTAGALSWLIDHDIVLDYSVGISSGAAYLCFYYLGRTDLLKKVTTYYTPQKDVVGFQAFLKEGHYVAYKHLFYDDVIVNEKFDIQPLIDMNPNMEMGAYDLSQGKTVWFGPKDLDLNLDLVRASCALPIASAVVEIDGHRLLDGGITKMIPIERALEVGCEKCLVITTKPKDYVRKPASPIIKWLMKVNYRDCPQMAKDYEVRHLNYYDQINIIKDLEEKGDAIFMYPTETIPVSRFKGSEEDSIRLYDLGYQDMENRKEEIFAFLEDAHA